MTLKAKTFSAEVSPGSPQSGSISGDPISTTSGSFATASSTEAGGSSGAQGGNPDDTVAIDEGVDGRGEDGRGVAQLPTPVAQ